MIEINQKPLFEPYLSAIHGFSPLSGTQNVRLPLPQSRPNKRNPFTPHHWPRYTCGGMTASRKRFLAKAVLFSARQRRATL
jgi:hypothetical protein